MRNKVHEMNRSDEIRSIGTRGMGRGGIPGLRSSCQKVRNLGDRK